MVILYKIISTLILGIIGVCSFCDIKNYIEEHSWNDSQGFKDFKQDILIFFTDIMILIVNLM